MKFCMDPNQQGKYSAFYMFAENPDETEALKKIAALLPRMSDDFTVEYEEHYSRQGCLEFHKKRIRPAKGTSGTWMDY